MRTGKRFTPTKIANWSKKGRGTGTLSDYEPWHQVTRGDPASKGRSQLLQWVHTERSHHTLSDVESDVFAFITMLPDIVDVREQFPLSLHESAPQLATYNIYELHKSVPGSLASAERLGMKHPMIADSKGTVPWIMSTDFVITLKAGTGRFELLAVSVKADSELLTPRQKCLLAIEKRYWENQGVTWLLITPSSFDRRVGRTIRAALPWGLPKVDGDIAPPSAIHFCANNALKFEGMSLTNALSWISEHLGSPTNLAQRAFWQAVWAGQLRLDLRRSAWPSEPIFFLDHTTFFSQNPVAARRSVCI